MPFIRDEVLSNIFVAGIIVFPLLFVWQGLDITDLGYLVSTYQQFFTYPENTWYFGAVWLTGLIGAVWDALFGWAGLVSFKLAYLFVIYVMMIVLYRMMTPVFDRLHVLLSLFLTVVFCSVGLSNWLSYNDLTSLFYIVAVYFLFRGLVENSNRLLLFSGIFVGLNIFVRFPNIVGILLFIPIIYFYYLKQEPLSKMAKFCALFFLGIAVAIVFNGLLILVMGHGHYYLESLLSLYTTATDSSALHSGEGLLSALVKEHIQVFEHTWPFILSLFLVSKLASYVSSRRAALTLLAAATVSFLPDYLSFVADLFSLDYLPEQRQWIWTLIGTTYFCLLMMVFDKRNSPSIRVLGLTACMVLFLVPLGSGNGIRNAVFGLWLALPIGLVYCVSFKNFRFSFIKVRESQIFFVGCFFVFSLFSYGAATGYSYTYRDTEIRQDMRFTVNHPMLIGVYTTQERARVMQELLDELTNHVKENDYLLAYEYLPGVNAFTKTQPYLYASWPMIYPIDILRKKLRLALIERDLLPVVVRAKGSTYNFEWPKENRGLLRSEDYRAKRAIITSFLKRKHYIVIWENSYFQILKPTGTLN